MEKQSNFNLDMEKPEERDTTGTETEKREVEKGGLRTMPFILANEICEKLAMVGFGKNMVNYLTQQLHMPLATAAVTITNYDGTASLTPLLGAFIADSYAGKFWTITAASAVYLVGMICLTLSAALPQLRPPPCQGNQVCQEANGGHLAVLYVSLLFAALGAGGIRPCVAAFGADQFSDGNPNQKTKTWAFFNWYYFALGASILLAATVLVYIQDNVGWGWGLGIPTIAMAVSIPIFVAGYPLYRNLKPAGSPYVRVLQVVVAAVRKRHVPRVSDSRLLYMNHELDASISTDGLLDHTKGYKFLDKAAIVTDETEHVPKPNLWRLNTVHRVEEVKTLIRMLPIWGAGILFTTANSQQNTFTLQQANTMERHLTKTFQIPSASMSIFSMISMLITIALYDRLLVPVARKFTGLDRGINFLQRMGVGFFISILATLVAGFVEVKRKEVAAASGLINSPKSTIPISVFWLVPQYSIHGIAEAFLAIGHLEFFYNQSPESMRSTATALFWTAISAGNYMSSFLVTLVRKYSGGKNGATWLPDHNLNKGKLENFYWLLTCLQVINLVYYLISAKFYTFKPSQVIFFDLSVAFNQRSNLFNSNKYHADFNPKSRLYTISCADCNKTNNIQGGEHKKLN